MSPFAAPGNTYDTEMSDASSMSAFSRLGSASMIDLDSHQQQIQHSKGTLQQYLSFAPDNFYQSSLHFVPPKFVASESVHN